jgi:two-component system chemotaxis response regulator CheB
MKILIVDDSVVFRTQITNALKDIPGVEIVGTAANGKIALQKLNQMPVDLLTLDMEMPEMNGMETLKELRQTNKNVKVLIFSSQTVRGAEKALDALREGADDVIAKPEGDHLNFETALGAIKSSLVPKIIQFTDQRLQSISQGGMLRPTADLTPQRISNLNESQNPPAIYLKRSIDSLSPQVLVIASSTGGPTALETIFAKIPGPYKIPVLITQHMPPVFTQILARRIGEITGVPAKEAEQGDFVNPNKIYVAPGDFHLKVQSTGDNVMVRITKEELRNSIRPAADYLFETAAKAYGSNCLGVVLTGMGEDGCDGAKAIKNSNGGIIIQNKASCTVFGMPGAVYESGAYDEMGDLDFIANKLRFILTGKQASL